MVFHLVLFKLKPEVTPEKLEEIMMKTRSQLLKIPVVRSIKCGKKIVKQDEWPFFLAVELETMDKLEMYREDPIHIKFVEEVIKPNTTARLALDYEMDPNKDVRYS